MLLRAAIPPPSLGRPVSGSPTLLHPTEAPVDAPASYRPAFTGDGEDLFVIHLKNFFLTLLTLGIYAFWGRAEVRRYLYGQTAFAGDRFTYHGTGAETFRGYLKAIGLVIAIGAAAVVVAIYAHQSLAVLTFYALLVFVLLPFALVGSRKYRLSRTSWRGIRFSFRGSASDFLGVYVPGALLSIVTLGLYYPYFHANVRRFFVDDTHFGHARFAFDGKGADLLGRHVLNLLLWLPTLGLHGFWYAAFRHRYYWEHTAFGAARFRSTVTGGALAGLQITNLLLLIVTLGIAAPWVQVRTIRFHAENLALVGDAGFETVVQDAKASPATGEEMAELLDVDLVGADFFGL